MLATVISVVMVHYPLVRHGRIEQRGPIVTLLNVMIVLSSFVFSIVIVMFVYAIWKFRAKPGDEADGEPIHGNTSSRSSGP